jgi:hypothetical protein
MVENVPRILGRCRTNMGSQSRLLQAVRMVMRIFNFERAASREPHGDRHEALVFAVSKCYPTRIVLYAAAFQAGWKVEFLNSLDEVLAETRTRRPRAVCYDHTNDEVRWDQCCTILARRHVPFVLLARKASDETFITLLGCGGYHAWGNPLSSEDIVKAVELAEEVGSLSHAPVA